MARIEYAMNKAQADEVFAANAVAMSGQDVIFDYKIWELFGSEICSWAESCIRKQGYLDWGTEVNSWGDCGCNYFYKSGFDKLVSFHNYHCCLEEYKKSEGGIVWDGIWQNRREKIEAAQREENRKIADRKAKRDTSRKERQAAS